MSKEFHLEILSPDRMFFSGDVESLVINTKHGEMGILLGTLPQVTTLDSGTIRITQNEKSMQAITSEGFVKIGDKSVTILASVVEWPYEVNADSARTEVEKLENILKKEQSMTEYKIAKAQLARQLARLRIKTKEL